VRADDETKTRDGAPAEAWSHATVIGARFHAAAEVREGMVGARGLMPPLPGRSAGAR
jgi:proline racemase